MAEIELGALSERLDDDELKKLAGLLDKAAVNFNVAGDHPSHTVAARLSEEALTEFLDRLDAHDIAAEIYLPVEFETIVTIGDDPVASAQALATALEEIKEELEVEEDEKAEEDEEDDDDDVEDPIVTAQLKNIWRLLTDACEECVDRGVPLHIHV